MPTKVSRHERLQYSKLSVSIKKQVPTEIELLGFVVPRLCVGTALNTPTIYKENNFQKCVMNSTKKKQKNRQNLVQNNFQHNLVQNNLVQNHFQKFVMNSMKKIAKKLAKLSPKPEYTEMFFLLLISVKNVQVLGKFDAAGPKPIKQIRQTKVQLRFFDARTIFRPKRSWPDWNQ